MTTIYSLCYSQNGGPAEDGPAIADFWKRHEAEEACPTDCVVVPQQVPEAYAEANCETNPWV